MKYVIFFALYGGSSADGMGPGQYLLGTTDEQVAAHHLNEVANNPYSTGHVDIFYGDAFHRCRDIDDWNDASENLPISPLPQTL